MPNLNERKTIVKFLNWATTKGINLSEFKHGYNYELRPSRIDKIIREYINESLS